MTLPKFIITMDGVFRLGMVNQHKHLLKPGDQCIGGGYYHFDFVSNRIILDRESYDFGRPKWHLLEVLKVPSTYRGMRIIYKLILNPRHDTLHVEVLLEQNLIVRLLLQIDFDEVFELFTQMPDGCRFPYLSGTSKQHGFMSGTCCPLTKVLIYDSFVTHLRQFCRKDMKNK